MIGSPVDSRDSVLLRALQELRDSHQPYQIPVISSGRQQFVLCTTHKDTYLALGKLDSDHRLMLCDFFEESFNKGRDPEMIFTFEPVGLDKRRSALQVIRSAGELNSRIPTFYLSPIH